MMTEIFEDHIEHNGVPVDAEEAAYREFSTAYPHESHAANPDRFWNWFTTLHPLISREEMVQLLAKTAEKDDAVGFEQFKAWVDAQDVDTLLRKWRFAPLGDPDLQGERGDYWSTRLSALHDQDPQAYMQASKRIGW